MEEKKANPWISLQKSVIAFLIFAVSAILTAALQLPGIADLTVGAIILGVLNYLKHTAWGKGVLSPYGLA